MSHTVYRVHEFAERAGITVRALHHYHRLGLLRPSGRTAAGYRLYSDSDFERLEQILMLKFLGLPLKQIGTLLEQKSLGLAHALRFQRRALERKRHQLDSAVQAIQKVERALLAGREPDWQLFKNVIEVIEMESNTEWMKQYYSDEARAKVEERKKLWSPELQAQVTRDWEELARDIEGALEEDPASPKAQELADRWRKLVAGFTGSDPQIQEGLNAMYADRENWPAQPGFKLPYGKEAERFIHRAMATGKRDLPGEP